MRERVFFVDYVQHLHMMKRMVYDVCVRMLYEYYRYRESCKVEVSSKHYTLVAASQTRDPVHLDEGFCFLNIFQEKHKTVNVVTSSCDKAELDKVI